MTKHYKLGLIISIFLLSLSIPYEVLAQQKDSEVEDNSIELGNFSIKRRAIKSFKYSLQANILTINYPTGGFGLEGSYYGKWLSHSLGAGIGSISPQYAYMARAFTNFSWLLIDFGLGLSYGKFGSPSGVHNASPVLEYDWSLYGNTQISVGVITDSGFFGKLTFGGYYMLIPGDVKCVEDCGNTWDKTSFYKGFYGGFTFGYVF
ncbi:hypothetical protein KKF34_06870 [Myxococcota bacterium]|nr:hypothetical protein [Myxococcota bacterium]MBU1382424.1 hypothetical protein [Myxococcota bacterium]MBU1496583.1 hypothetical protein [Myxococcota bacterium]